MAINLSINLNKVALLRNSRGHDNPSPRIAAHACIDAGASGLTLHWRADNRHTRAGDVRDQLIALAAELRVDQFTLVPVRPGEVTSDHGWDLPRQSAAIAPILERL